MKFFLTLLWLGSAAVALAGSKFAAVRVTDIYRELPSTAAMFENLKLQRAEIIENKRAENLRAIIVELQSLQAQLEGLKDEINTEQGKSLVTDYEIKRQEAETLRQEFEEFRAKEEERLNKFMVSEMRASLDRITDAATQLAKERNLDGVLDTSGNSNTGLPFVLYAKNTEDLTEDVVELLTEKENEKVDAETEPAEPAEPTEPTEPTEPVEFQE